MYKSEKEFEADVEAGIRALQETYVGVILHLQERRKEGADETELGQIEELIRAAERMIVYFMKSDDWVRELHENAQKAAGANNGSSTVGEPEDEFERLEKAGNFERTED